MQPDTSDRVPVAAMAFEPPPMDGTARRYAIPWDWWDAVGIYVVWLVLSAAAGFGVQAVVDPDSASGLGAQIMATLLVLILITLGWIALRGAALRVPDALRRLVGVKQVTGRDVVRGVGYGLVAFVVVQIGLGVAITRLVEALGREMPAVQEVVQEAVRAEGGGPLLIGFAVAVLAPMGEELLFRGVLYQALAKHLPGWPAIGLSGLAFGATHLETFVILLTFPLGMGLAWMMRRHGTLVVPVVAHAVFNVIGVVVIRAT